MSNKNSPEFKRDRCPKQLSITIRKRFTSELAQHGVRNPMLIAALTASYKKVLDIAARKQDYSVEERALVACMEQMVVDRIIKQWHSRDEGH